MNMREKLAKLATPPVAAFVRYNPYTPFTKAVLKKVFYRYLIWRPFQCTTTICNGMRMNVRFPDLIQTYLFLFGIWEPAATEYLKSRLKTGDLFVDIGANVGYFSLLASSLVGPNGKVISIEASPTTARELQQNVRLNELRNVEVICAAVSDTEKTVDMYMAHAGNRGSSSCVRSIAEDRHQTFEATIRAFPLHKLVPAKELRRARVIKMDVEGAEADVFKGIHSLLPDLKADWLFEFTPELFESEKEHYDVLRLIADAGYFIYQIENDYDVDAYLRSACRKLERLSDAPTTRSDLVAVKSPNSACLMF